MGYYYAIGPVSKSTDEIEGEYYHAPVGSVGWIDTRPIVPTQENGFFAYHYYPAELESTHAIIGDGNRLEEYIPTALERSAWETLYGVTANSSWTLLEYLRQLFFVQADPDGLSLCKPGTPTHTGHLEIHLGGHSRVLRERFTGKGHDAWPALQRLQQASMARLIAEQARQAERIRKAKPTDDLGKQIAERVNGRKDGASFGDVKEEMAKAAEATPGKALTNVCRKYRCEPSDVLPRGVEVDRLKPETAISDDFNRAALGGDWTSQRSTWSIYSSTELVNGWKTTSSATVTHNTALSSDDHFAQIKCTYRVLASASWIGPMCRAVASSTRTYYGARLRTDTEWTRGIVKYVADALTNIAVYGADCSSKTIKLTCDGSTQYLYVNGTQEASSSDSSIDGNLVVGVDGHPSEENRGDDFAAEDLLAATTSIPGPLAVLRMG